jgi:beta-galactosidase
MYQGDEAYHREQEHGLRTSIDKGLHASGTTWEQLDFNDYPSFWDYQRLFTRNTNRSWRTWGINAGWLYWLLEGYGDPPGEKRRFTSRYKLASPLTSTPSWVNPRYEIFKDANQPLLAYIAGYPLHTDKTHTFFSGEAIKKQIAVVWDGSEQKQLQAEWKVLRDGAVIQKGNSVLPVEAGGIRLYPIEFTAPAVQQRQLLKLVLSVKDKNSEVQRDTLLIDVFAKPINKQQVTVAVYDPLNKSVNWLKQLRVNAVPWKKSPGSGSPEPGRKKFAANILIIGREALKTGMQLPYTAKDVANGLKVIILEQQPDVWEGMGFQTIETMPRYVFIRDAANPVIKGLLPRDFINWRGSPDLLPEGKYARTYDVQKAPKWTNTHAVASVVIKTPEVVGFTPVLQTEFDMAYSLLLEWRYGKGMVTFCTIDLTGRAGVDPVATLLAANLLKRQLMTLPATKKIYYAGDTKGKSLMDIIGVQQSENISTAPGNAIIVAGNGEQAMTNTAANAFVVKGGCVFYLPQSKSELAAQGFITNEKEIIKVAATGNSGLLRAIGPNFLRWKDVLSTNVFSLKGQPGQGKVLLDGIALEQNVGKGKLVHVQVGPALLSSRYEDSVQKKESIQLSVIRLNQLTAQLLTNLGASPADAVAERLTIVAAPQTYQTLGTWKVLGPYTASTANGETTVNTVYAGEQDAIEGGENPNNTHRTTDGKLLDWRKVVNADKNGFIDLRKAFPEADELAVAYVTKSITSAGNQTAVLRLGVDFWMEAWLNGKSIVKVTQAHQKRENEYVLQVPLQKGENILTLKVASGRGGFGFWANMSVPSNDNTGNSRTTAVTSMPLYSPLFKYFDPYQFSYW